MKNKTYINSAEQFFHVLRKLDSEPVNLPLEQQIPDMCFILFSLLLNKPSSIKKEQFLPYTVSEHAHKIVSELKKDYWFSEYVLDETDQTYSMIANFIGYTKFADYLKNN